jgi:hypothetical protein
MAAIFELDQFDTLPLWAQVLVASRVVRRGMLAMLPDETTRSRKVIEDACIAIEWCAEHGGYTHEVQKQLDTACKLREKPLPNEQQAIAQSIHCAVDACRAAEAAQDFPVDATVTASAKRAFAALASDPRVNRLQLTLLIAGDFDLVRFACSEIGVQRYNGLTKHVFGRLAPVHPLDLQEPQRSPEDDAR